MIIFNSLDDIRLEGRTSVALGNFDGLHIGHQKVMKDAAEHAKRKGMASLCFTFSNHPFNYILQRSDDDPDAVKLICTEDEKISLVEGMGFDILVNIPFDDYIMKMRAHEFFSGIIEGKLAAGYISVGFNYTYGARAEGKSDSLIAECNAAGIGVTVHDPVTSGGRIVSSTLIREMIKTGNMERTAEYLGRPYTFSGTVKHGKHIGTGEGYPTINIPAPGRQMLPPNGVYFSRTLIGGQEFCSISNIGINPTVNNSDENSDAVRKTIETFIFDFDSDVYGDEVTVCFDHFSRGERRFRTREDLFDQIGRDCEQAKEYHRTMYLNMNTNKC